VRAFGTVFMFLPLNMATLGPIPKKDVAAASGFFNLTRQVGGSIGVALLTTLLARREAMHRVVLIAKLVPGTRLVEDRLALLASSFAARGFDGAEAHQRALAVIDGLVNLQAAVLSFGDTFWATAALIVFTLPLILMLGKPSKGIVVDAGH
jgi:DHA2 family multidrug resistance protein